jgi:hypothetical protein
VREGAYTPPSGVRMTFLYEDVSRETDKRTAAFAFPGVDGSYVQDNGYSARRYPLRCYFAGPSHDLQATAFELALLERGRGRLEHPFYGAFDVVPFGTITRRDDLKTAANQSVVEVTFWASLDALYPSTATSPRNELLAALDAFDFAQAQEFAALTSLDKATARAATKAATRGLLRMASDALSAIADAVTAVNHSFRDAQSAVNYGIDVLVGQPLQLAQQVANLVRAPALARVGIQLRLEGYRDLADRIFGTTSLGTVGSPALAGMQLRIVSSFHTADLFASQALAGSLRSVVEHTYGSKAEALAAADAVLAQLDALVDWRDGAFGALGLSDPGATHQALRHAAARAAGQLVESSFDLAAERRLVIDRPRTIIDIAAELYGSVDDRLDYLIETNGFTGAEILELPTGTSVAYYL